MANTLFLIPLISAFAGWFASRLAITMLFYPRQPRKIFGITIQGALPRKQKRLVMQLAKVVSSELFAFQDLEQKVSDPENVSKILPFLESQIDTFLREKLTAEIPMLGMLIGDKTISQVKAVFVKELQFLFPLLMKQYMSTLKNEFDIEKMITEKSGKISSNRLNILLRESFSSEISFVTFLGALLGFVIGLIQVLLTIALK